MPCGATHCPQVSSSIQLLFQGLKFSFKGSGNYARFILEYAQVWSYQEYHKYLECCERVISGADARSRNALVAFKEVSHTAFFPRPAKVDAVSCDCMNN